MESSMTSNHIPLTLIELDLFLDILTHIARYGNLSLTWIWNIFYNKNTTGFVGQGTGMTVNKFFAHDNLWIITLSTLYWSDDVNCVIHNICKLMQCFCFLKSCLHLQHLHLLFSSRCVSIRDPQCFYGYQSLLNFTYSKNSSVLCIIVI